MGAARDLGTLRGTLTVLDFVGQSDTADYYRFHIDSPSSFRLRMDGLSADADVYLVNAQGAVVASSAWGGSTLEGIDRVLESGDYSARVTPYGAANTNYRLWMESVGTAQQGLDLTAMSPLPDYTGHLGADYPAAAGTASNAYTVGNYWQGHMAENDPRRINYVRPELAWSQLQ